MSKIHKVKWTSNAKEDLLDIVAYIKKDSISAAREVYEHIKEKAQSTNFFPLRGRVVPELQKEGITVWSTLHGLTSLLIDGFIGIDDMYDELFDDMFSNILSGLLLR